MATDPEQVIGRVPGIQPTIQRAGQYGIQVQRAGRNKLMDLADALSQVNPTLQQYIGVAEQEAEMFEEELARKSPEEVQAMLKQTEGELDKQVRRGTMGWLTSPLNQKRKLRAVGQASSRLFMEQVYNRLDNPQAGDEDLSTSEVISLVQQEFVSGNEALSGSMFAQEGLQEAVNPQILPLVRQYDAQKNRVAKGETAFGTTSVFYDLAKEGNNLGDYDDATSQALLGAWENLSAFSAAEQRDLFGKVLDNLARNGMEEKADSLLLWAQDNLKIGAAKLTDIEVDSFETRITSLAEAAERLADKDREDKLEVKVAQFENAHTDIEIDGVGTYNGEEVRSIDELILKAKKDPAFDDDEIGLAQLRKSVDDFIKSDIDPREFRIREIIRSPFGPAQVIDTALKELSASFTTSRDTAQLTEDVLLGDEVLNNIGASYLDSFQAEIEQELQSLLSGPTGSDKRKVTSDLKDFIRTRKKEVMKEQENAVQQRLKFLNDKENFKVKTASTKKASEPGMFGGLYSGIEEKENKLKQDVMVFTDTQADTKERVKAFRNLRKTDGETMLRLQLIAAGEIPKVKAQQPQRYFSVKEGSGGMIGREIKRVEYTQEEKEAAFNQLVQVEAAKGYLGEALLLKEPVTRSGLRFNPTLLNSAQFPLVSKEDILELVKLLDQPEEKRKESKIFKEAAEKARIIGEEDVLEFIRNQRQIYKQGLNARDL
jgi:hypothetical protein